MEFVDGYVALTWDEWDEVFHDRMELKHLRQEVEHYRESAREYLAWSLGGGMMEAVFAGMQLAKDEG